MKRKIDKSKLEACKLVWKKRIAAEKGISEKCAEKTVQSCIELIERMLYGNAMIAFHKQDGTFCMEQGTLVGYEKIFTGSSRSLPGRCLWSTGVWSNTRGDGL